MKSRQVQMRIFTWITILIWVLNYIATKIGLRYTDAMSLTVMRAVVAGAAVGVMILVGREKLPKVKDLPLFLLLALFGFVFYPICFHKGTAVLSVATTSVIIAVSPIMTAILAAVFFGEKLKRHQILATLIEFCGVLIVCLWDGVMDMHPQVLWVILAMLCFTGYNLLTRKMTKKYSSLQVSEFSILFAGILFLVKAPQIATQTTWTLPLVLAALFIGVFASAIAYACWNKALNLADKTTDVTNNLFINPFLSSILGFIMLKEVPSMGTVLGGILIVGGLLLFNSSRREK